MLPDELPTVRALSSDFEYLLDGFSNNRMRINMTIEYAEHLKTRFEPGVYSDESPEYARNQVLPRLYLDSMLLTTRRRAYHSIMKHRGGELSPDTMAPLMALIDAKLDLQKDISDYISLNPDRSGVAIFGNLAQISHHSRRMLYGDEVTEDRTREENLSHLCGILAEYKVLSALHERWPKATFGSVEQDTEGTDIIVPSLVLPHEAVALQVKSLRNGRRDELSISTKDVVVPVVRVPMDPARHELTRLRQEHSAILKRFVQRAPTYQIAFAA
ncbi:hypothetical protein HYU82_01675 [Candidatus Saccharibacteria bacterium]|nr:hypothetical protein [Candidatus Saccharibacteria bacterium]